MADRLKGKVAIVTGAAPRGEGVGNGMATAILFAREGAKVVLVNRSAEPVGSGERRAGPEQRHLEILRPCRGRDRETGGQDRQAPSDAHVAPPSVAPVERAYRAASCSVKCSQ